MLTARVTTRRKLIGLSAIAVAATLCLPGDGFAITPKHAKTVTHGSSPFSSDIRLVAGSSGKLVYSVNPARAGGDLNTFSGQLYQFTDPGSPAVKLPGSVTDYGFSIAQDMLTARRDPTHIDWWNFHTRAHGTLPIGFSTNYLGAAPNGFVYEGGDQSTVFLRLLSGGAPQNLGQPFAGRGDDNVVGAVSSDQGIAYVGSAGHVVYASWGAPSFYTSVLVGGETIDFCNSMNSGAIGCTGESSSGEDVVRLNTDGLTGPIVIHGQAAPGYVSVAVGSTGWLDFSNNSFRSAPSDATGPIKTYNAPVTQLVAAGGGLIFTPGIKSTPAMYASADADASSGPQLFLRVGKSPAAASAVSLTAGRIGYVADEGRPMAVWSRSLTGSTGMGTESLLVQHATETGLSLSGASTAATIGAHTNSNAHYWASNPLRTAELGKPGSADGSAPPIASGNRVLYVTSNPITSKRQALVYNFGTGKSVVVPKLALSQGEQSVALWGSYLAYAKSDGSIWRMNLDSHAKPQKVRGRLTAKQRHHKNWGVSIHEWGDFVGWSYGLESGNLTGFRNMAGRHRAVNLHRAILIDLTDAGALSQRFSNTLTSYVLRSYTSKKSRTVLTDLAGGPVSIADGRIAWVADNGAAKLAKLPGKRVKEQPRYLGDAAAKRRRTKITLLIPTSAPLTKCSVRIGTATMKCRKKFAAQGDAVVRFKGGAGTYSWSLHAKNADGVVLAANGKKHKVKGTLKVK